VITKGDVGGAQTHVAGAGAAQVDAGNDVTVVAGTDGPMLARCRDAGIETVVVPALGAARARPWSLAALGALRSELHRLRPDIVHAHSSNAGLLARIASRLDGHACVYTAHGWPFQRGAPWSQRAMSLAAELIGGRIGDGVICLTDAEAERARRARVVRRRRVWVIANGLSDVDPSLRRIDHDQNRTEPVTIVMVARFAPPKAQRELVDVLAGLLDLDWMMTFVGDGPDFDDVRRHGERLLGDRVEFLGHRDDVAQVIAASDVAVLWSRYEGMPISLLEAMRAGVCCVASDLPGVRALFGADPPGGLTAADAAALADVLRTAVSEPATRRSLGECARMRYEQCYSSAAMQASTAQVYDSLLERRRSGGRARRARGSRR
jgi:glycosyltransferase involved in cell wall biosynthesis